jgi:hypothetical protein
MSRRSALALAIFLVSLIALSGLWAWAGWQAEIALTAWTEAKRAQGWTVTYKEPEFSGWPLRLTADLGEPALVSPRDLSWRGPPLALESTLWAPLTLQVAAPGRHDFDWPPLRPGGSGGQAALEAAEATGTAHFSADGWLRRLDAHFRNARLMEASAQRQQTQLQGVDIAEVNLRLSEPMLRDASGTARIRLDAREIVLPNRAQPALGRDMARLAFDGRLSGVIPGGPLAAALQVWRDSGGEALLDSFDMEWGPLDLRGEGVLRLDDALRPEGELTVTASGMDATIDRLAAAGLINSGAVFAAKLAIETLGKREEGTGRRSLTVPINLRGGLLYLGPVALFPVPPLPHLLDPA